MAQAHNRPTLLTLPAEIREDIYKYTFTATVNINFRTPRIRNAGILLACRQTYQEAIELYYTNSIFRSHGSRFYAEFLSNIKREFRDMIQEFRISRSDRLSLSEATVIISDTFAKANIFMNPGVLKVNTHRNGEEAWTDVVLR